MADNNQRSMAEMQRDAERRMRDMQQRAARAVNGNDMPPVPNFVRMNNRQNTPPQSAYDRRSQGEQHQNNKPPQTEPSSNSDHHTPLPKKGGILSQFKGLDLLKIFNFKNIHIDNDVLIIIALIFLLSTDETDELLLLALVYIML